MIDSPVTLGAVYLGSDLTRFRVWAPSSAHVDLHLTHPAERIVRLRADHEGYHAADVRGVEPGHRYLFRLSDGKERPDPASRLQSLGVHSPSEVVDPAFEWHDHAWTGRSLRDYRFYEAHVGTFSTEGTFDAVHNRLGDLATLGITAVELMPVAQFPGDRNWGYDGVYPFAVQGSYGGPAGLKRLVDACHSHGLAVVLDVVYNHLGPEGNYLADFGPYFTHRYRTPWGQALNFDGPGCDEVRRFFIENALYWQTEFHIDALRLDAVHAICDASAFPFLAELAQVTQRQAEITGRRFQLIAESDLNDARVILPAALSGWELDAQWSDDFHHSLHVLLTGESDGYYADFDGIMSLARAWRDGYAYTGQYSPHRQRRHGNSPRLANPRQFVVCAQNHDQIGNRGLGERLAALVDFESQKVGAAATLLSPFLPLLFMGEEYGETAPFQYFTSHSDPALAEAVRHGRKDEFAAFHWREEVSDPQDPATFAKSRLQPKRRRREPHRTLFRFYQELFRIRRDYPALTEAEKETFDVTCLPGTLMLIVHYRHPKGDLLLFLAFASVRVYAEVQLPPGKWRKRLDSADLAWRGRGPTLPDRLNAAGKNRIALSRRTVTLFERPR